MQLRIWAEMIVGGMYSSKDDPPNNTMFARAGGQSKKSSEQSSSTMTKAITDVACAITNVLSPKSSAQLSKGPNIHGCSPVKTIESRSKLYKQLSELSNLKSMGVLSEEEYLSEKQAIMNLLKEINCHN